jgi:hypothetical protein
LLGLVSGRLYLALEQMFGWVVHDTAQSFEDAHTGHTDYAVVLLGRGGLEAAPQLADLLVDLAPIQPAPRRDRMGKPAGELSLFQFLELAVERREHA